MEVDVGNPLEQSESKELITACPTARARGGDTTQTFARAALVCVWAGCANVLSS